MRLKTARLKQSRDRQGALGRGFVSQTNPDPVATAGFVSQNTPVAVPQAYPSPQKPLHQVVEAA